MHVRRDPNPLSLHTRLREKETVPRVFDEESSNSCNTESRPWQPPKQDSCVKDEFEKDADARNRGKASSPSPPSRPKQPPTGHKQRGILCPTHCPSCRVSWRLAGLWPSDRSFLSQVMFTEGADMWKVVAILQSDRRQGLVKRKREQGQPSWVGKSSPSWGPNWIEY